LTKKQMPSRLNERVFVSAVISEIFENTSADQRYCRMSIALCCPPLRHQSFGLGSSGRKEVTFRFDNFRFFAVSYYMSFPAIKQCNVIKASNLQTQSTVLDQTLTKPWTSRLCFLRDPLSEYFFPHRSH